MTFAPITPRPEAAEMRPSWRAPRPVWPLLPVSTTLLLVGMFMLVWPA